MFSTLEKPHSPQIKLPGSNGICLLEKKAFKFSVLFVNASMKIIKYTDMALLFFLGPECLPRKLVTPPRHEFRITKQQFGIC